METAEIESAFDEARRRDCLIAFERFELAMRDNRKLSVRAKAALRQQLILLLQFITIETLNSISSVTAAELDNFFAWSEGFYEHDIRVKLGEIMASLMGNPGLKRKAQSGNPSLRLLSEILFWRRKHKKIWQRTRDFFNKLTQEDILRSESGCITLYQAYRSAYPLEKAEDNLFLESDQEVISAVAGVVGLGRSLNITDIGCGEGRLLKQFSRFYPGSNLTGTSIFPFSEAELSSFKSAGITPVYCSASRIDIPDASQDIVVSTEVIEHLRNPADMLAEIKRILKPGGVFCVTAPGKSSYMFCKNPLSYLAVALAPYFPSLLPPFHNLYAPLSGLKIVHYGFDPHEFRKLFGEYFSTVEVQTYRFVSLRKFRLDKIAPKLPVLKNMGGGVMAVGQHKG
ncbi:MAG: methyltransferase domain-containing protein [Bdellovibrionota bacterium]